MFNFGRYWILLVLLFTSSIAAHTAQQDESLLKKQFISSLARFPFSFDYTDDDAKTVARMSERWFIDRDPTFRMEALFADYKIASYNFLGKEISRRLFARQLAETRSSKILGEQLFAIGAEFHIFLLDNSDPTDIERKRTFLKHIEATYGDNTEKLIYLLSAMDLSENPLGRFFKGLDSEDVTSLINTKAPKIFLQSIGVFDEGLLFDQEFLEIIDGNSDPIVKTIHAAKMLQIADDVWTKTMDLDKTLSLLERSIDHHKNSNNWMIEYHRSESILQYAILACVNEVEQRHNQNISRFISDIVIFRTHDDREKMIRNFKEEDYCQSVRQKLKR